jgi:chitodextrinase
MATPWCRAAIAACVVGALIFGIAPAAQAAVNVVPNPGFEQAGCGASTPIVCGWRSDSGGSLYMDSPHSGASSLSLSWSDDNYTGMGPVGVDAQTDPAFCAEIGPGAHPASFWYANANGAGYDVYVSMGATFYQGTDCSGSASSDSLTSLASGPGWQQLNGDLTAPQGTQSALFALSLSTYCAAYGGCSVSANFDDLDVEDAAVATPAINDFSPTGGPAGTSVDIRGANLTGATGVQFNSTEASFTVDSNSEIFATVPGGATAGPITVTTPNGTTTSSSSFAVSAPTISSFFPTSGPGGTNVTIQGENLSDTTSVNFNGAPAQFYFAPYYGTIIAIVPAGATTGPISLTTPTGTATSSSSFAVITADTTPPETTITSGPLPTTTSSAATFEFSASEPSTFECSLDTALFADCGSPTTYAALADGPHTFRVRATDAAGNTDPTPAQQTWIVQPNARPTARFTVGCTALSCRYDASGSADSDGTITSYAWDFGDGTGAAGSPGSHAYAQAGSYLVTLTVTDDGGATNTASTLVRPISLAARGYKQNGLEKVQLSWNVASGRSFDIYRNGIRIVTVPANTYTYNINNKVSGVYTYQVCEAGIPVCSNTATVSFRSAGS